MNLSREQSITPPRAGPAAAVLRLLVADDDAEARAALGLVLGPGFELLVAADGQEALDLARASHPDIILLDLAMPKLDGFEVLERLAADPATAEIPVLLVSARHDEGGKVRGLGLGAVDYIEKPFSMLELRARVERTVRHVRSQGTLRAQARTDPLTELANRRTFFEQLESESRRARRYHTHLTCVMADLDGLKAINDDLGHRAGDRAIAIVAEVLRAELRATDLGARYGGDEFVLLLPHTGAEEGRILAERIGARLGRVLLEEGGVRVPLGASFGVACLGPDGQEDPAALLRAADAALYRAKAAGRGRVEVAGGGAWPGPRS